MASKKKDILSQLRESRESTPDLLTKLRSVRNGHEYDYVDEDYLKQFERDVNYRYGNAENDLRGYYDPDKMSSKYTDSYLRDRANTIKNAAKYSGNQGLSDYADNVLKYQQDVNSAIDYARTYFSANKQNRDEYERNAARIKEIDKLLDTKRSSLGRNDLPVMGEDWSGQASKTAHEMTDLKNERDRLVAANGKYTSNQSALNGFVEKYKNYSYADLMNTATVRKAQGNTLEADWLEKFANSKTNYQSTEEVDEAIQFLRKKVEENERFVRPDDYEAYAEVKPQSAEYERQIAALEEIRSKLEKKEAKESFEKVRSLTSFDEVSSKRIMPIPSRQEIYQKSMEAYQYSEGIGTYEVPDRLGLYLEAKKNGETYDQQPQGGDNYSDAWGNTMAAGERGRWEDLTQDEINTYYFYLNSGNKKKADEYLDSLAYSTGERAYQVQLEDIQNASNWELAVKNLLSVPANVYSGVAAFLDDAFALLGGDNVNPYTPSHNGVNLASAVRTETAQRLSDSVDPNGFWGQLVSNSYQGIMSGVDSLLGGATLGAAYTFTMGMGAAAQRAKELYEQGATRGQIAAGALISGAIETITEYASYDFIVDQLGDWAREDGLDKAKRLLRKMVAGLAGATNEGIEEVKADLWNMAADAILNGYASANEQEIRTLMVLEGLDREQAQKEVVKKRAIETLWSFYGGFLSGGLMTAGADMLELSDNKISEQNRIRDALTEIGGDVVSNNNLQQLGELTEDAKLKNKIQTLAETDTSEMTDRQQDRYNLKVGKAYESATKAKVEGLWNTKAETTENYVRELLAEKGVTAETEGKLDTLVKGIAKSYNKEGANLEEQQLIKKYGDTAKEVLLSLNKNRSELQSRIAKDRLAKEKQFEYMSKLATPENAPRTAAKDSVSDDGKTYVKVGEELKEAKVTGISSVKTVDGKRTMTVNLSDGTTANLSDVTFGSETEAVLYQSAMNMNVSPATAQAIVNGYSPNLGVKVNTYLNAVEDAVKFGKIGVKGMLDVMGNRSVLPQQMLENFYKFGEIESQRSAEQYVKKQNELKKGKTKESGSVTMDESLDGVKLKGRQKATVKLLQALSSELGIDIELFASPTNKNGVHIGESGSYNEATGAIRIDIYAGMSGKDLMLFTAAHELTHFFAQNAKEEYNAFTRFLLDSYVKKGVDVDTLVKRQQDRARTSDTNPRELSYDAALEEMVADSCESFLRDSDLLDKVVELARTDMSLAEKIALKLDEISKALNSIRKSYANFTPESEEGKMVLQMTEEIDGLRKTWSEGILKASQNYKETGGRVLTPEETKAVEELSQAGFGYDAELQTVYAARNSTAFNSKINRNQLIANIATMTNRSLEDARRFVEAEEAAAKSIKGTFLDFEGNDKEVAIKQNSDYPQGTIDLTNICPKRVPVTYITNRLQEALPNDLFTAEDYADIRNILMEDGRVVACGLCFVEDRRQYIGEIAQDFIKEWNDAVTNGTNLMRTNSEGKRKNVSIGQDLAKRYGIKNGIINPSAANLTQETFMSSEKWKQLQDDNPYVAAAFEAFNNARGQSAGRLLLDRAEYKREILKWSPTKVANVNAVGGLRIFSFSDFETVHLLDLLQIIEDCAAKGVMIQGYTKQTKFAKLVSKTGIKLNRSFIPYGATGIKTVNGIKVLAIDTVEGINNEDPDFVDESDNPNVGNNITGINDEQIHLAMKDKFFHYIIPFHTNKKGSTNRQLGVGEWRNYKPYQTDKTAASLEDIRTVAKLKKQYMDEGLSDTDAYDKAITESGINFSALSESKMINIYTEVIPDASVVDAKSFVDKFLQVCKESNIVPRYPQFLNVNENGDFEYAEGYEKFLVDFKLFDESGKIVPQGYVTPEFDSKYIDSIIADEMSKTEEERKGAVYPEELYKDVLNYIKVKHNHKGNQALYEKYKGIIDEQVRKANSDEDGTGNFALSPYAEEIGAEVSSVTNDDLMLSDRVTDKKTLDFLNKQIDDGEYITTYKAMRMDGLDNKPVKSVAEALKTGNYRLHSPMAALINGQFENEYELGQWYQAAEHPELMRVKVADGKTKSGKTRYKYLNAMENPSLINADGSNLYFNLDKGKNEDNKKLGDLDARYNPYEHSSNFVINDQFKSAYKRNNLVVVEMRIPKSELTSGYKAQYAKDAVGWTDWKTGDLGTALAAKGKERMVALSRWSMPVRVLTNEEVASKYKELLDGTGLSVPNNTVTPSLLSELEKAGVSIDTEGIAREEAAHNKNSANKLADENKDNRYSLRIRYSNGTEALIKNPSQVSDEEVVGYLKDAKKRKFLDESFIPLGRVFPNYLVNLLRLKEIDAQAFPLIMNAKEAKRAQTKNIRPNSGKNNTGHSLSPERMLNLLDKIYNSEDIESILHQPNGRISIFTKGEDGKSEFVVVEFSFSSKEDIEIDEGENSFDVLVTLFIPDEQVEGKEFDYYDYLISQGARELYDEETIKEALANFDIIGQPLPMSSANASSKMNPTTSINQSQESSRKKFSDRYSSLKELDTAIDSLTEQMVNLDNEIRNANDSIESLDEVVAAKKKMWAAQDAGKSGLKEKVEYRQLKKKLFAEKYSNLDGSKIAEWQEELNRLRDMRKDFIEVKPISKTDYNKLVTHFGTTSDMGVAGFILTDGRVLDFSGKKQYGSQYAGGREIYHNEIGDVIGFDKDTSPRINMVNNGNIRLVPETNGINLGVKPTKEQLMGLRHFIDYNQGNVRVDIDNKAGTTEKVLTYRKGTSASKIISDINTYFDTGDVQAESSSVMDFHYSDRDPEGNTLSAALTNYENVKDEIFYVSNLDKEERNNDSDNFRKLKDIFTAKQVLKAEDRELYAKIIKEVNGYFEEKLVDGDYTFNVKVVDSKYYTNEMLNTEKANKNIGYETKFFIDRMVDEYDSSEYYVEGLADTDNKVAYVKVNSAEKKYLNIIKGLNDTYATYTPTNGTASGIARHERLHLVIDNGLIAKANELLSFITDEKGKYVKTFDKINYWYQSNARQANYGFYDYAQEIACDLYSGMLTLANKDAQSKVDEYITAIDSEIEGANNDEDIRYQQRQVSNRELLANAYEGITQNDIEKKNLAEYKSKIAEMNKVNKELAEVRKQIKDISFAKGKRDTARLKELNERKTKLTNRLDTYDKTLLRLEASSPLMRVLENAKKQAAVKQTERIEKMLTDAAAKKDNTVLRNFIKAKVKKLDTLLVNPTKEKHIPSALRTPVRNLLQAIDLDAVEAQKRIAAIDKQIKATTDAQYRSYLEAQKESIQQSASDIGTTVKALSDAYAGLIRNSTVAYDEIVAAKLESAAEQFEGISIWNANNDQLNLLNDALTAVSNSITRGNRLFRDGKAQSISSTADKVKAQVKALGDPVLKRTKLNKKLNDFYWSNLKPINAMKLIGSNTFTDLFNDVRKGEDTWAIDMVEAQDFFTTTADKYGYDDWKMDDKHTFTDSEGKEFTLTTEQIMSLAAYARRRQADRHLQVGGFIFGDSIEVTEKKKGIPLKYRINDATPYRLAPENLASIVNTLTDKQRQFVYAMQDYLSNDMGAKGNEVSREMYDIDLFREKFYFPLKSSRYYREFDAEQGGTPKIKNSSFAKDTVKFAQNPIVLENFMDVWASHIDQMSMYHAFTLPIENFTRVYNYSTMDGGYDSVQATLKNYYGDSANRYIENLLKDLNGGARPDANAQPYLAMISKFKRAAVMASASVVIQQPSAMVRAMAYIDPKYFVKRNSLNHKQTYEELKKYAPVAIIKEMGRFDTNTGRSNNSWLTSRDKQGIEKFTGLFTDADYRDDVFGKAPQWADEFAWNWIWDAAKNETKAKYNLTGEELLKKAGERFTQVIVDSQVYDSVLSRSQSMRSNDALVKIATSFMAEPTTVVNMLNDARIQWKRGNKTQARKTVGSVIGSVILNAALVSIIYAMRDDDDDKTYAEKYAGAFLGELIEGFNIATYIPFVKDIVSLLQGYDVERADMSLISSLVKSYNGLFSESKSWKDKLITFGGDVANLFGLPVKNIYRDVNGLIGTIEGAFDDVHGTYGGLKYAVRDALRTIPLADKIMDSDSKSDKLYDAYVSGRDKDIERYTKQYADESKALTGLKTGIKENDDRIGEAAQLLHDGDSDGCERLIAQIVSEGHFDEDLIRELVESAYKKLAEYDNDDLYVALDAGDTKQVKDIIDTIITEKQRLGKTKDDIKSSLKSTVTSYYKSQYLAAYSRNDGSEMTRIRKAMHSTGLYDDVSETCQNWVKNSKKK